MFLMDIELENKIIQLENGYKKTEDFISLLRNMHKQDELISERLVKLNQIKKEIELLRSQNTILR